MPDFELICACGLAVCLGGALCGSLINLKFGCLERREEEFRQREQQRARTARHAAVDVPSVDSLPRYESPAPSYVSRSRNDSGYRAISPMSATTRGRQPRAGANTQRSQSVPALTPNVQQHQRRGMSASRANGDHPTLLARNPTSRTPLLRQL